VDAYSLKESAMLRAQHALDRRARELRRAYVADLFVRALASLRERFTRHEKRMSSASGRLDPRRL